MYFCHLHRRNAVSTTSPIMELSSAAEVVDRHGPKLVVVLLVALVMVSRVLYIRYWSLSNYPNYYPYTSIMLSDDNRHSSSGTMGTNIIHGCGSSICRSSSS